MRKTAAIYDVQDETLNANQEAVFQWDHVIRLFLQDHCSQGPVQMVTKPSNKFQGLRTFHQLLEDTFRIHGDAITEDEKKVWRHQTSSETGGLR